MKPRPSDEEIARDYELWVKYVHDEIPDGEFYKMTVREKLEIITEIRNTTIYQAAILAGRASSGQASLQISTSALKSSSNSRLSHRLSIPTITLKS